MTDTPKPRYSAEMKFKVGDRVRIIGEQLHPDRAAYAGLIGEVVNVHEDSTWDYTVDLGGDYDWDWFSANELEADGAVAK